VVLFDEIEKAHPDVFNILLQILDEGTLTDSVGRRVDFRNTVVILTSNIGTRDITKSGYGFGLTDDVDQERMEGEIRSEVNKLFNPEFVNRLDDFIVFNALGKDQLLKIVDLQLADLKNNLASKNVTYSVTKGAKEIIIDEGYDKAFGARPLRRTIQTLIENVIAEKFLRQEFVEGGHIRISTKGKKLHFSMKVDEDRQIGDELVEKSD
jgi:ATP-dependent Clp protease ATP-binding subunit ClpC